MQDHPNSISVVPFGDSKADNAQEETTVYMECRKNKTAG